MEEAPENPLLTWDHARLIFEIRRGDPEALREAYRRTFDHDMGRLVLAHHLSVCGVGSALGAEDLKYKAGRHDAAIELANAAGFDQAAIAPLPMTQILDGAAYDGPDVSAAILDDLPYAD